MTTRPHWPEAARAFKALAPRADLGLHLNLTLGRPLGAMPVLAGNGAFPTIGALARAAWRRRLPLAEIRGEIVRQLDAFADASGGPPDFVDGHQHVQVLPGIADQLIAELAARGLAGKTWLRNSADRPMRILARGRSWAKALTVSLLASGFGAKAKRAGFKVNDGFAGFSDFKMGSDCAADFAAYLRAPGARPLIMCHPGYVDDELEQCDRVTVSRPAELNFLLSERFVQSLAAANAQLTRMSAMTA
jgi:predicted glycoside hydrolase/deacetylase ChbG (UPF0249 family)